MLSNVEKSRVKNNRQIINALKAKRARRASIAVESPLWANWLRRLDDRIESAEWVVSEASKLNRRMKKEYCDPREFDALEEQASRFGLFEHDLAFNRGR
tara:strand:+ start:3897 stop:4193 length:297 start_codon:yes stop_codon:yes gene_type:complete